MAIREIHRSALVTFTPEQMFDLVIDVERYPEFLPWVATAKLHERSEHELLASMECSAEACANVSPPATPS
jgi:ribosome-associated toxin RatA of RatAB toxin-antitoxin module